MIKAGDKPLWTAYCPACKRLVGTNRDGTFRRHRGGDEFDQATDGICSWSHSLPPDGDA